MNTYSLKNFTLLIENDQDLLNPKKKSKRMNKNKKAGNEEDTNALECSMLSDFKNSSSGYEDDNSHLIPPSPKSIDVNT